VFGESNLHHAVHCAALLKSRKIGQCVFFPTTFSSQEVCAEELYICLWDKQLAEAEEL